MTSQLYRGEKVIDDDTSEVKTPNGLSTGYRGMFRSAESAANYSALPPGFLIPQNEWQARIEEMEQSGTRLSDLIVSERLPPKDQKQTNYCWIFAPTHAVEIMRLVQGQKPVSWSPASAGAQIKNFRNEGGWGEEGLQWIADKGLVPSSLWPDTTWNNRSLASAQNLATATEYRATEWDRLKPRDLNEMVSCLLHRKPVPIGLNWWGHEVLAVDPVWLNGKIAIRIRNSWGDIPDFPNGFGILQGNKMYPDDAVCLRTVIAS